MFKFFNRRSELPAASKPALTENDKGWVEQNLLWFVETFGMERMVREPFLLPSFDYFPYKDLKDENQFRQLFEQLCRHCELDPNEIKINIFDNIQSRQWNNLAPIGKVFEPGISSHQTFSVDEHRYIIRIGKSNIDNPELLTMILSHELTLVKYLDKDLIRENDSSLHPFIDLATIFGGFGIFVANCCEVKDGEWHGRYGYLLNNVISYANALICYLSGKDAQFYSKYLNANTRSMFLNDFAYLQQTNDTAFTKQELERCQAQYELCKSVDEGFKSRNFSQVIDASNKLKPLLKNHNFVYNNIGYALLQQKKYAEAIENFTLATDADPYHDYAFNNRGYAWLQLGNIDNAYIDLQGSLDMNPSNSFNWRNMGAYYLHAGDYNKALEYFEKALSIDPKTELIHFYLAHAHTKLGNTEKAKNSFDKSKELNEHNDSMLE